MLIPRKALAAALLLAMVVGCGSGIPEPAPGLFVDVTTGAGLGAFRHERGAAGQKWMPETYGAGASFVDYDGDGWVDIAAVGGNTWENETSAPPAIVLYRNLGDGRFEDATRATGLDRYAAYGFGVTAADYDNDGDADLFLTALGANHLFRNDGGVFTDIATEAGVAGQGWSTAALFLDANRDGWVDLYVGHYVHWTPETDHPCTSDGQARDYCMPHVYAGAGASFYLNTGDGRFVDRTEAAGLAGNPGKTLGVAEYDLNGDDWPDFVVANDTRRNLLYINRGDGTFAEGGVASGVAYDDNGRARAGMGIDIGVLDETGEPTIVIGNFSEEMVGVYREAEPGLFRDRGGVSGIGPATLMALTFGVLLADIDSDTDLDVLLANGHILESVHERQDGVTYRQPAHLFLNRGDGAFTRASAAEMGPLHGEALVARGIAGGDYDRDGDVDVLLTENGGPIHLWQNQTNPASRPEVHALRLYLEGRQSNRGAVGARVEARLPDGRRIERRVRTGGSYLSQSETVLTLGLGSNTQVDTLRIHWPSGQVDQYEQVEGRRELRLVEGETQVGMVRLFAGDVPPVSVNH